MELRGIREVEAGRRWMGRMPGGEDLTAGIVAFCGETGIHTAVFSVMGTVAAYTIGAFDPVQQVYVTENETAAFDIVACRGNVSTKDSGLFVRAHICLADVRGRVVAGRLFSETPVREAEIDILEITGPVFDRRYDSSLGLDLWPPQAPGAGVANGGRPRTAGSKRK
jgi:predicted DNA-binding protein with PD1-like motif